MVFLVHVTRGACTRCDFDEVKMCSKWMARKTTSAYLLVTECYGMHRLIVTHKKAMFCLLVHHNQALVLLLLRNVTT